MANEQDGRPATPGEATQGAGDDKGIVSAEDEMIHEGYTTYGGGERPGLYAPGAGAGEPRRAPGSTPGATRAEQIGPDDPHELSEGRLIECLPTGGRGAGRSLLGASVLGWDPAVHQAGVDTGYAPTSGTLRAPDLAVGNVPDQPGWVRGAPDLAIEYADLGQDEGRLQRKIQDLLEAGTTIVWVPRLAGPRRVEIYQRGQPVRTAGPGEQLVAPGILANPVPVDALFDRAHAEDATLTNLLQRRGYAGLDAVLAQGHLEATRAALRRVLRRRGLALGAADDARIDACPDLVTLERWLDEAAVAASVRLLLS